MAIRDIYTYVRRLLYFRRYLVNQNHRKTRDVILTKIVEKSFFKLS